MSFTKCSESEPAQLSPGEVADPEVGRTEQPQREGEGALLHREQPTLQTTKHDAHDSGVAAVCCCFTGEPASGMSGHSSGGEAACREVSTGREMLPEPLGAMRWTSGEAEALTVIGMASHVKRRGGQGFKTS